MGLSLIQRKLLEEVLHHKTIIPDPCADDQMVNLVAAALQNDIGARGANAFLGKLGKEPLRLRKDKAQQLIAAIKEL